MRSAVSVPSRQLFRRLLDWRGTAPTILTMAAIAILLASGIDLPGLDGGGGGAGLVLVWAFGHCDGLDGPVVTLARKALEAGDVNQVLPWVRAADETEIRNAFDHAREVRKLGAQARELADTHFFETLVRIHRAGEGAPFTGLKPAGRDLGPAIPAADRALEDGSVDRVVDLLTTAIREGVHRSFQAVYGRRRFDSGNVEAGREFVAAYVPYIHYVERLWKDAQGGAHGHHPEDAAHSH